MLDLNLVGLGLLAKVAGKDLLWAMRENYALQFEQLPFLSVVILSKSIYVYWILLFFAVVATGKSVRKFRYNEIDEMHATAFIAILALGLVLLNGVAAYLPLSVIYSGL